MKRGFSLAELLTALAILFTCIMLIIPMMQYAYQYGAEVDKANLAALIGQSKLDELRSLSYADLLSYPSSEAGDPDHPDYHVQVNQVMQDLYSPNRLFEWVYPPANRRLLGQSARKVEVDVNWPSFGRRAHFQLVSLIGLPPLKFHRDDPIRISGAIPAKVARDQEVVFSVSAYDQDGHEIPDLFFSWSVEKKSGSGTMSFVSRDGRQARFQNLSYKARAQRFYTGGQCAVQAKATYRGEERWGFSQDIELAP